MLSVKIIADATVVAPTPYDFYLGPLGFPTLAEDVKESLGSAWDTTGAAVTPSGRRARPFDVTIPVHGKESEVDPFSSGDRMRRQAKALLDNEAARVRGQYVTFRADPELNAFVAIGSGDLAYADGGVSLSEYELALSDSYILGTLRTHKPARRLEVYDRRAAGPKDYLGLWTGTSPGGNTGLAVMPLHANIVGNAYVGRSRQVVGTRTGLLGPHAVLNYSAFGGVVTYEVSEQDLIQGGVRIYDRRGYLVPPSGFNLNGDIVPDIRYGWEGVYGLNYALTPNDVPIMQNGICRIAYDPAKTAFLVSGPDAINGYTPKYGFTIYDTHAGTKIQNFLRADVVEWTQEQAVIRVTLESGDTEVYITLRDGWLGPRVEVYGLNSTTRAIRIVPVAAGASFTYSSGTAASATDPADGAIGATFTTAHDPFAALTNNTTGEVFVASVMQTGVTLQARTDTDIMGASRRALSIGWPGGGSQPNYIGVTLAHTVTGLANGSSATGFTSTQDLYRQHIYDIFSVPELVARGL